MRTLNNSGPQNGCVRTLKYSGPQKTGVWTLNVDLNSVHVKSAKNGCARTSNSVHVRGFNGGSRSGLRTHELDMPAGGSGARGGSGVAVDAVVFTKLMEEQGRLDCNALLKEMSLLLGGGPFPGSVQDRRAKVLAGEKTEYVRYVGPSEQRARIIENIGSLRTSGHAAPWVSSELRSFSDIRNHFRAILIRKLPPICPGFFWS